MVQAPVENIISNIEGWIKSFISFDSDIAIDQDLLQIGFDSFSIMRLVVQIEMHYEIEFDNESLVFEKLSTIERLTELVQQHL